jgi:cytochrome c-type biogenesis protein CcmH/NrfG
MPVTRPASHAAAEAGSMVSALDHKKLKSRFFGGVTAEQHGDHAKAAEIWPAMLAMQLAGRLKQKGDNIEGW